MRDLNGKRSLPSGPHGGGGGRGSLFQAVRTTCKKAERGLRAWKHEFGFTGRKARLGCDR